jgi:cell division protein FtsZ
MINLSIADADNILRPRITVMGVGGAGGNAVNNMIRAQLEGCDFVAANTDAQALASSLAPRKIQLGISQTRGLGAGSKPDVGRTAAEEQMNDILACLEQTDMLFVTAGMGGGTGTGAAPVIARLAREAGILTVGVVTKPFDFEGGRRRMLAEQGLAELQQYVDTLIIIPNQNLFRMANERTTFADAFRLADEVLHCGVRGITDLMVMPGFMNLDFADVKTVMGEMGKAMMGTGEAEGENRALRAAEAAISNPLLEDTSMKGAKGVLINITGGLDLTLFEVDQAANRIREEVDPDAQIKVGSTLSENLEGVIRVSVIATGIEAAVQTLQGNSGAQSSGSHGMSAPNMGAQQAMAAAQNVHQGVGSTIANGLRANPNGMSFARPQTNTMPAFNNSSYAGAMAQPAQQQAQQQQSAEVQPATEAPQQPNNQQQQAAPTGNLRGQQIGGNFVAPRPLEASRTVQSQQQWQPAPRQQPQQTNLAQPQQTQQQPLDDKQSKRADSLFTRITGFGLVRPSGEQEGSAPVQQRLNIENSDRPNTAKPDDEEDLLEIPTFLRRQTNH